MTHLKVVPQVNAHSKDQTSRTGREMKDRLNQAADHTEASEPAHHRVRGSLAEAAHSTKVISHSEEETKVHQSRAVAKEETADLKKLLPVLHTKNHTTKKTVIPLNPEAEHTETENPTFLQMPGSQAEAGHSIKVTSHSEEERKVRQSRVVVTEETAALKKLLPGVHTKRHTKKKMVIRKNP
jgi:hypothetical protein